MSKVTTQINIPNFWMAIGAFSASIYLLKEYSLSNVYFPITILFVAFWYFGSPFILFLFFFFVSIFEVFHFEQTKKQYVDVYNNDFDKELYLKIFSR